MPQFVQPLAASTTTRYSQSLSLRSRASAATPRRKRKYVSESDHSSSAPSSDDEGPDAATNPLSLTPDEIAQYKLAGLSLDQSLPSLHVSGWPHGGFKASSAVDEKVARQIKSEKGTKHATPIAAVEDEERQVEAQEDSDETHTTQERAPQLRNQHFAVLTTILHRCLLERDIERAKRAWALMVRYQSGGKGVDLRSTGYWGIGAELLVRSIDTQMKPKSSRGPFSYDSDSDIEQDDASDQEDEDSGRWGTAEGLQKAKDYYERLIIEHPFKRQWASRISALDFWPCMTACEIYGIQFEQKAALHKLELYEQQSLSSSPASELESSEDGELDGVERDARRIDRRTRKLNDFLYTERERIRTTALDAVTQITTRLDERMTVPPYSDSNDLLRLRGMLALYVGDLCVPDKPTQGSEEEEIDRRNLDATQRFLNRERLMNWERGILAKQNMTEKAMAIFTKMKRVGGDVSDLPSEYLQESGHISSQRGDSEE